MSEIDFQSIRYTVGGLECYYCGQRKSGSQILHRFAVATDRVESFQYYDDQGRRLEYVGPGMWVGVSSQTHDIIKPRRKVEVTRWLCYHPSSDDADGFVITVWSKEPSDSSRLEFGIVHVEKVTVAIEVPE